MKLPNDPVMLLSAVNMLLRDKYSSIEDFASAENVSLSDIVQKLSGIGYNYKTDLNQFV
jgi:hypothetical protein